MEASADETNENFGGYQIFDVVLHEFCLGIWDNFDMTTKYN